MTTPPLDTDRLRDLLAKATHGPPWHQCREPYEHEIEPGITGQDWGCGGGIGNSNDVALIVAAVNALPALLDYVTGLEDALAGQTAAASKLADAWEVDPEWWMRHAAVALRAALSDTGRHLLADLWDSGHAAGADNQDDADTTGNVVKTRNPYREET